jgi:hypothetical protein
MDISSVYWQKVSLILDFKCLRHPAKILDWIDVLPANTSFRSIVILVDLHNRRPATKLPVVLKT